MSPTDAPQGHPPPGSPHGAPSKRKSASRWGLLLREPGQRPPGIGSATGTRVGDSPEEGLRSLQMGRDEQEVVHQTQEQAAGHGRAGLRRRPRSRGQVQSHFPQRTEAKADLAGRGSAGRTGRDTAAVTARGNAPAPTVLQATSKPTLQTHS